MADFTDPSTDTAKFITGFNESGWLGASDRLTKKGDMRNSSQSRNEALEMGLPQKIRGNPLGCACHVAYLVSVGPVIDGQIEADYQCDSGWHNYVVFQVRQYTTEGERGIKINKFGDLIESEGFQAGELESM